MTFKLFSLRFFIRVRRGVVGGLSKVRGAINIIDTHCCLGDFKDITSNGNTLFSMQLPVNCHIAALDGCLVHLALIIVIVIVSVLT